MADRFSNHVPLMDSPFGSGFAITPSDSTEFDQPTRSIYVGGAGDVVVVTSGYRTEGSIELTFKAVPVGTILPVRAKSVKAASTATFLIGLY